MTVSSIKSVIKSTVGTLTKYGYVPHGITSDQGSNFQKFFSNNGLTREDPAIYLEDQRYLICRDPPHLLKNSRNFLLKAPVYIPGFAKPAEWAHIVAMFKVDQKNTLSIAPRLSNEHLYNIKFQNSMKVKLAAQVLSNSVSGAIKICVDQDILPKEALATSTYCKIMNDLFDCLNSSSSLSKVPLRRPIFEGSPVSKFLLEKKEWLRCLLQLNKKRKNSFIQGKTLGTIQENNFTIKLLYKSKEIYNII